MPKKNLIIFCIFSFVFLFAWTQFEQKFLRQPQKPPTPKPEKVWLWDDLPPPAQSEVAARLASLAPGAQLVGLDTAWQLAAGIGFLTEEEPKELLARHQRKSKEEPVAPVIVPAFQAREIPLGNADFNLQVTLTTQGGGVRQLILTKFQGADRLGHAEWLDEKKKEFKPLNLIPNNPAHDTPISNLLYHYAKPDEQRPEHPLDTLGKIEWKVTQEQNQGEGEHRVVFTTTDFPKDFTITKTFTLSPRDYHLGLTITVERKDTGPDAIPFRYQLTGAQGLPVEGEWYTTTYRTSLVGLVDAKGFADRDLQDSRAIGFQLGGAPVFKSGDKFIRYAGVATQYFASVIAVDTPQEKGVESNFVAWARPTVEEEDPLKRVFLDDITMRVISEPASLKHGDKLTHRYLLYNGPVKVRLLKQRAEADEKSVQHYIKDLNLDTLTDFHLPNWFSRTIAASTGWSSLLIFFTNVMHGLLWYLHVVIPNYGLCIILLTVMVRGMMFPLSRRQAIASARMQAKMQELAPEVKKLEEKFKNDSVALQQAKQELYLKKGINPLAMMGSCWMVFLQMPIFLGLYYALQESINFRLAGFWPTWVHNLAAPDMMIWWGENIPWVSRPQDMGGFLYLGPYFNLLPIFAVALMIVQQKLVAPPPTNEQEELNQKLMKYMMVFFGLMFYKVAAGLCIYFIASSLWGVMERKMLPKANKPGTSPSVTAEKPKPSKPSPQRFKQNGSQNNGNGAIQKVKDWWEKVLKEAKKK